MNDLDLSGVDPLRWGEIRRRVAVITDFLAIGKPTQRERDEHARRLGIGTKTFMRLVAIWRAHREARLLDGAGRSVKRPLRRNRMPDATRQAVIDAAQQVGPDALLAVIVARAATLCNERSTPMVGRSAAWNVLMEARRSGILGSAGDQEIIVASVAAKVPVLTETGLVLPRLDLAVLVPEGAVVSYQLSSASDRPPNRDLVLQWVQACATTGADQRPVSLADDGHGSLDPAVRKRLTATLGRGLVNLSLLYQAVPSSVTAALPTAKVNAPLTPADAAEVVRQAVRRHNTRRCPNGLPRYSIAEELHSRP
jgi:hypothetical protein